MKYFRFAKWQPYFNKCKSVIIAKNRIIISIIIFIGIMYGLFIYRSSESFYLNLTKWNGISLYFTTKNKDELTENNKQLVIPFNTAWIATILQDNHIKFKWNFIDNKDYNDRERKGGLLICQPMVENIPEISKSLKENNDQEISKLFNIIYNKPIQEGNIVLEGQKTNGINLYLNNIGSTITDYNLDLILPPNKPITFYRDMKNFPIDYKKSWLEKKIIEGDPVFVVMQDKLIRLCFRDWSKIGITAFTYLSQHNDNNNKIIITIPKNEGTIEVSPNNKSINIVMMVMADEKGEKRLYINTSLKGVVMGMDRSMFASSFRKTKHIGNFVVANPEGKISIGGNDYNLSSEDVLVINGDDIEITHGLKGEFTLVGNSSNIILNTKELIKPFFYTLDAAVKAAILTFIGGLIVIMMRKYFIDKGKLISS